MTGRRGILFLLSGILSLGALGCGVKGDPVAPATPAEIGRGTPVFKGEEQDPSSAVKKKYFPENESEDDQEVDEN